MVCSRDRKLVALGRRASLLESGDSSGDFKASLKPVARAFGTASIQALHNKGYTRHGRPRKTAQSDLITCLRSARQYLVFIRNAQRESSYKRNIDLDW